MKNVMITNDGDDIVIRVKATAAAAADAEPSSTGKTKLLGTTSGAVAHACTLQGVKIALNVTIPNR